MKLDYLSTKFWAALLGAVGMIAVTLGIVSQEESDTWIQLVTQLIAAVLPIVALILGYSAVRAAQIESGLLPTDTPAYLTLEFWMTLAATITMVLVSVNILTQEQSDIWLKMLGPFVAAVLAIVAYVRGRSAVRTATIRRLSL